LKRRYTVIEAAKVLGVGTDAVRKRVARGTVEYERVDDTVYVWLDNGHDSGTTPRHDGATNGRDADLLDAFRDQLDAYKDQVAYLRSSLDEEREARRRADTIIAQLTQANAALAQRVPELEAPQTPEEAARDLADAPVEPPAPSEPGGSFEEDHERPWRRRVFG
jgi:hypothetical protein